MVLRRLSAVVGDVARLSVHFVHSAQNFQFGANPRLPRWMVNDIIAHSIHQTAPELTFLVTVIAAENQNASDCASLQGEAVDALANVA